MSGEEICDIVPIARQAALMSRWVVIDRSEISAFLIGKTERISHGDRKIESCDVPEFN
jgi:hypothetical protein